MAFAPPAPPPSVEHLAQISEALCARAEAREQAAKAAAVKRGALWRKEILSLRNTAPPKKVTVQSTGAAAVLEARLARICPPVQPQKQVEKPPQELTQNRIDAYNARMAHYFTPISEIAKTTLSTPQVAESGAPAPTPPPTPKPKPRTKRGVPFKPLTIKEPILAAAPTRKAITPMPVKPMLKGINSTVKQSAKETVKASVKESVETNQQAKEEGVQRPSWLVDFIVGAVSKFTTIMKKKEQEDQPKSETEAVAW